MTGAARSPGPGPGPGDRRSGPGDRRTGILWEIAYPVGDPAYPFGVVARPAIQLPFLCLLLLVGLLSGLGAVLLAVSGEPVGDRQDPAAAVAMVLVGLAMALIGLVVGAGREMFRQARTNGWTRPTPREEVPPLQLGTLRATGHLVAVGGVATGITAAVILVFGWDLSPVLTLVCALAPAVAILLVGTLLGRRGGATP